MHSKSGKIEYPSIFFTCPKFSSKYKIIQKIDEGSTANIFKIQETKTENIFALKSYNQKHIKGKSFKTKEANFS